MQHHLTPIRLSKIPSRGMNKSNKATAFNIGENLVLSPQNYCKRMDLVRTQGLLNQFKHTQ